MRHNFYHQKRRYKTITRTITFINSSSTGTCTSHSCFSHRVSSDKVYRPYLRMWLHSICAKQYYQKFTLCVRDLQVTYVHPVTVLGLSMLWSLAKTDRLESMISSGCDNLFYHVTVAILRVVHWLVCLWYN